MSTTTVGERVREARRRIPGFTQQSLAQAVDVSRVHIGRIECGMRSPSARLAGRLARVLDVPVEELRR